MKHSIMFGHAITDSDARMFGKVNTVAFNISIYSEGLGNDVHISTS